MAGSQTLQLVALRDCHFSRAMHSALHRVGPRQAFWAELRLLQGCTWAAGVHGDAVKKDSANLPSEPQQLACLTNRAVLRLQGKQLLAFLQGMVTNDVLPLGQPGGGPVYTTLLSPKGKVLHDLFLYPVGGEQDTLLADVDARGASKTIEWLNRYKLRRAIDIRDVSSHQRVWVTFGGPLGREVPAGWHADPRLPQLGYRTVLPAHEQPSVLGAAIADVRAYFGWRYMHGVAEGETEIITEKAVPLDYGLDVLNGVSYVKGCYIGQERNSFTHYRGVIRRRAMPVRINPPADLPVGTEVRHALSGAKVGTILGAVGEFGLAHLRLKDAQAAMAGGTGMALKVGGHSEVEVLPFRPSWWLPQWGHEEDEGGPLHTAQEPEQALQEEQAKQPLTAPG